MPQPPAAEPAAKAEPAAGGVQAQIGTYVSDARAAAEWERLKKRLSPVLDSYDPLYVPQTRSTDGRTLWLVRVGSFASRDEATRFCDEVKAKGHPDCKPILRP
ncbi:hypothetical protein TSO221_24335 [Azospirillum sp. TSO22-1]|nr:hypothetical protein TSO221_24335 [Azospirillum sp. TSO22-1]